MEKEEQKKKSGNSGNRMVRAAVRKRTKTLAKKAEELWKTTGTGVACILKTPWGEFRKVGSPEDSFDELFLEFKIDEMINVERSNSGVGQIHDNNDDPLVTVNEEAIGTVSEKGKEKMEEDNNSVRTFDSKRKRKAKGKGIHIEEPNI